MRPDPPSYLRYVDLVCLISQWLPGDSAWFGSVGILVPFMHFLKGVACDSKPATQATRQSWFEMFVFHISSRCFKLVKGYRLKKTAGCGPQLPLGMVQMSHHETLWAIRQEKNLKLMDGMPWTAVFFEGNIWEYHLYHPGKHLESWNMFRNKILIDDIFGSRRHKNRCERGRGAESHCTHKTASAVWIPIYHAFPLETRFHLLLGFLYHFYDGGYDL